MDVMDELPDLPIIEYLGSPMDTLWQVASSCAEVDTEMFYPEEGDKGLDAKKVCRGCDVREDCLRYALANHEQHGIWGGLTRKGRRQFARKFKNGWVLADLDRQLERDRIATLKQ